MPAPTSSRYLAVRRRLDPLIAEIAAGALGREAARELPRAEVRRLLELGFGRLRLPVSDGGDGLSFPELAEILIDLGEADSNLPQIFRGHIGFVEGTLRQQEGPARDTWLGRLAAGELVGNAWTETAAALGETGTRLTERGGRLVLNGRKFYSTGSIFADWADVAALSGEQEITVAVRIDQPGVRINDDWDGFGQRLTGTGTIIFEDAFVDAADIIPPSARPPYQTALFQLVLLAVQAGIAAAIDRDTAAEISKRSRAYSHGSAALPREDPLIQSIAGSISATAFTARALVREVAAAVQDAVDLDESPDREAAETASTVAEIRSAQAQVILGSSVTDAATALFGTLGASATRSTNALDRNWRNARTVASHNPVAYKQRIVGDWAINGTRPPFSWRVGDVSTAKGES